MGARRDIGYWIAAGVVAVALVGFGASVAQETRARNDAQASAAPVKPSDYKLPALVGEQKAPVQPIAFSHARHVGTLSLPCATCHVGAGPDADKDARSKNGKHMTLPTTQTCMNCHVAIATDRPGIQALAKFHAAAEEVPWVRVYHVLNGVNWTHKTHIGAGIQCTTCHGDVGKMQVMTRATPVTAMATCLNCHRATQVNSQCETCHAWPGVEDFRRWSLTDEPPARK